MSTAPHAGHVHNAEANGDPTRTLTLRRRFEGEMGRRFRRLKGLIRTTVGYENDAFGLAANAEPADTFDFPTDPAKQEAFMRWLRNALGDEIVEVEGFAGVRQGRHYTAKYVRASYARAIKDAGSKLRAEGLDVPVEDVETMFNLPVHEQSLQRLYTRTYENLEGISGPTAKAVREELTQGFVEGVNPNEMARRLNDRVDAIGLNRARTLARTETIHSHAEGTLDRFQRAGVENVSLQAEWLTAGDLRVCELCAARAGDVLPLREARGLIPLHPMCRCAWSPVVS